MLRLVPSHIQTRCRIVSTREACHRGNENNAQGLGGFSCTYPQLITRNCHGQWQGNVKRLHWREKNGLIYKDFHLQRGKKKNQILLLSQWLYIQRMALEQNNCKNHPVSYWRFYILPAWNIHLPPVLTALSGVSREHWLWSEQEGTSMRKAILRDCLLKTAWVEIYIIWDGLFHSCGAVGELSMQPSSAQPSLGIFWWNSIENKYSWKVAFLPYKPVWSLLMNNPSPVRKFIQGQANTWRKCSPLGNKEKKWAWIACTMIAAATKYSSFLSGHRIINCEVSFSGTIREDTLIRYQPLHGNLI